MKNYAILWTLCVVITVTAFGTWGHYYGYHKGYLSGVSDVRDRINEESEFIYSNAEEIYRDIENEYFNGNIKKAVIEDMIANHELRIENLESVLAKNNVDK